MGCYSSKQNSVKVAEIKSSVKPLLSIKHAAFPKNVDFAEGIGPFEKDSEPKLNIAQTENSKDLRENIPARSNFENLLEKRQLNSSKFISLPVPMPFQAIPGYLRRPDTSKISYTVENNFLKVGSSSMQGWRKTMEDKHVHLLDIPYENYALSYFAVFDGHGGSSIAKYLSKNLHTHIIKTSEFSKGLIEQAIVKGVHRCDKIMQTSQVVKSNGGSTAVFAFLINNDLFVGNIGDSRIIGCRNGIGFPLSKDHKPRMQYETDRITKAGGHVSYDRVMGRLAVSRAFGDFEFKRNRYLGPKKQMVTAHPDVFKYKIDQNWEFILLACDGIWDVMTNDEVTTFVLKAISRGLHPKIICEQLLDQCLSPELIGIGCDNMTVILICFLDNQSYHILVERCRNY